jgi:beta-N-acetylhexosaminidase
VVAGQELPGLGAAYVLDLAQPVHPAWRPYFDGLPDVVRSPLGGLVIRTDDPAPVQRALAEAAGHPLLVAVQDAVRTPWMAAALRRVLAAHPGPVVVLCTGIPEDRALVPDGVPVVTTSGRNPVVLGAVTEALTGLQGWAG